MLFVMLCYMAQSFFFGVKNTDNLFMFQSSVMLLTATYVAQK
jgi:hypothetical protein